MRLQNKNEIRRYYLDCRYNGQTHGQAIESTESHLGIDLGSGRTPTSNNRGESF